MGKTHFFPLPASFAVVVFLTFLTMGCASDKSRQGTGEIDLDSAEINEELRENIQSAKQIFYSMPSPLETAMLIKSAGASYNEDLLNPVENSANYTTNKKMALNLGIYTTDLSFASLFDQTQTSIRYMNAAKAMAEGLGILDAIDQSTVERLEENVNNRDVIMNIVSETFMSSSSFLKENERSALASIVLVGGWIEGLYIAGNLVEGAPIEDNKLVERIVDQKLSFDIVMNLLNENRDHPDVSSLIPQITDLKESFDKIKITTSKIEVVPDEESNVTVLRSESKIDITPGVFNEIINKVKVLRTNFIS